MSKIKKCQLYMLILCISFFAGIGTYGKMDVQAGETDWTVSSDDEFEIDENGVLQGYTGNAEVLMIPEGVKSIRDYGILSDNKENVKKVVIPDSLETLGRGSFKGFTNLEEVIMGDGLKTVKYQAFASDNKVKLVYSKPMKNAVDYNRYSLQSVKTIELGENYSGNLNAALNGSASPNLENVIISENNTTYFCENGGIYSKDGENLTLEGYLPSDATATFVIKEGVTNIKSNAITPRLYKDSITAVFPSTLITTEKNAVRGRTDGLYTGEGIENKINIDVSKCTKNVFKSADFSYFGAIYADSVDGAFLSSFRDDSNWPSHKTITEKGMIPVVVSATTIDGKDTKLHVYSYDNIEYAQLRVYDENNALIKGAACMSFVGDDCTTLFIPNAEKYAGKTVYVKYADGMDYESKTVEVKLDENANAETVNIKTRQNNKVTFSYNEYNEKYTAVLVDKDYHYINDFYSFQEKYDYEFSLDSGEWKLIFIDRNTVDFYPYNNESIKDILDECGLVEDKDYLVYDIEMGQENIDLGKIDVPEVTSKLNYFKETTGMTIKRDLYESGIYYIVYFDYERTAARLIDENGKEVDSLDFVLKVPNGYEPVVYHTTSTSYGPMPEYADNDRNERISRIYHSVKDNNIYFTDKTIYNGSANYTDRIYMKVAATDVKEGKLKLYWSYDDDETRIATVTLNSDMLAASVAEYSNEDGAHIKGIANPDSKVGIYRRKIGGGAEELVGTTKANSAGFFVYDDKVPEGTKTGDSFIYHVEEYDASGNVKDRVEAGITTFQFDVPKIINASCEALGKTYVFDMNSVKGPAISYAPRKVVTFNIKLDDKKIDKLFIKNGGSTYELTKQQDGTWVYQGYNNVYKNHMDIIGQVTVDGKILEMYVGELIASWIIDPSGQAYEAVAGNYVEGAKATIYYKDPDTGKEVLWDATDYYQINPIITDKLGNYAWDVPVGKWKIRLEKDGYTSAESEWMTVPPIRTGVNLELKSVDEAEIKGIELGDDKITITFDKYIYLDSVNKDAFTLKGLDGDIAVTEVVPVGYSYRNNKKITKRVSLMVEGSLKDGEPESGYIATVKPGFTKTYADVVSTKEDTFTGLKVTGVVNSISAAKVFMAECGQYFKYSVDISGSDSFEGKVIKAEIADDSIAEVTGVTRVDENNQAYVVIKGKKLGETEIKISIDGSPVEITQDVYVLTDAKLVNKIASANNMYNVSAIEQSDFPEFHNESAKETPTPAPSSTPTPESTATPEVTPTANTSATPEVTPTPDASAAPEVTATPDASAVPEVTPTPDASAIPEITPTPDASVAPEVTATPDTTAVPEVTPTPDVSEFGSTVKVGKAEYVIGKDDTVTYKCSTNKKATSITIPATVKINGKTYKVTAIAANAFKNNKKLKKVTIGENVKTIGKNAFYGCKKLKTVTIKTSQLTKKTVGKNAFAKINSKAKVKVPKSKLKAYKKLLKSKGIKGKKQKITKAVFGK